MKVNLSDKIAFNGRRENWQNYENFRDFFEQKDSVTLLRESLSPDFKAGEGFSSRVYSICGNDTFMLKVDKFEAAPLKKISLKQEKDYFPELNLGQKIASLNEFASVIIRQNGLPCGIKHFENKKYQQVTKADLPDFIDYLRKVSEFPQESYDDFEKEIKTIHKRLHMFDFVNSQNVHFEEKTKSFNIVDIIKRKTTRFLNCDLVMPMALLDFQNYSRFLLLADAEQKMQIYELSKKIIEKSYQAYYGQNRFSQHLMIDFYANFIGIKNGRELTNEFFKMKRIIKSISAKI